ncbi:hypothetical protein P168DRAFT_309166 [Aspergillus campestris IBT 28561]|uniref:rRNA methyltransferase 1, mitochondrial n=1 Tax=Aspergillus campestris (strain IBT 28561) TaxID=1392248 RepID=A0A2I1DC24_ASPC2|nr:uncharacterized protein P168DRAFT_309166 [Aspergillus campestris IBT 28561]PKY07423.1 hypothetical protein P168DRAFT_309166 [Aspergillus campestris IBT 28561]
MFLHSQLNGLRLCSRLPVLPRFQPALARHASLRSAIDRGIRKSQGQSQDQSQSARKPFQNRRNFDDEERAPHRRRDSNPKKVERRRDDTEERSSYRRNDYGPKKFERRRDDTEERSSYRRNDYGPKKFERRREGTEENSSYRRNDYGPKKTGNFRALPMEHQRFKHGHKIEKPREEPQESREKVIPSSRRGTDRPKENVKVPDSIPYTTPASEFIYGTNAVEAALRCSRRQLYTLYLYQAFGEELSPAKSTIRKVAYMKNLKVKMAYGEWDKLLDKMSAGRPHNGCILEASPLPQLPVRSLRAVPSKDEDHFSVDLGQQSREEAQVNGMDNHVKINHPPMQDRRRFPVVLLLDGVVDTGNYGAIIRSAYFLGIDAIVLAGRNSAPLSPVTIKASAGAAENMTLLQVHNEVDFIQKSKLNGWRFYAADVPGPGSTFIDPIPSVIMMGSEASGLTHHIKSHADSVVSIPGSRFSTHLGVGSDPARVDSLNVSVAAALLMEMFLRVPLAVSGAPEKRTSKKA